MVEGGKSIWHQPSLWPDTTELCSDDKCVGKTVDEVTESEVRSEASRKGLFHQHDDGFGCIRWCRTPNGDLFGVSQGTSPSLTGAKTVKMAGPPHNSGLREHIPGAY